MTGSLSNVSRQSICDAAVKASIQNMKSKRWRNDASRDCGRRFSEGNDLCLLLTGVDEEMLLRVCREAAVRFMGLVDPVNNITVVGNSVSAGFQAK